MGKKTSGLKRNKDRKGFVSGVIGRSGRNSEIDFVLIVTNQTLTSGRWARVSAEASIFIEVAHGKG